MNFLYIVLEKVNINQRRLNLSVQRKLENVRLSLDGKLAILKTPDTGVIPDDFLEFQIYSQDEIRQVVAGPNWSQSEEEGLLAKATKSLRKRTPRNSKVPVIDTEIA